MKRVLLFSGLLLAGAGSVYLQTANQPRKLATLMPGGALLYLESPDFARLLREWDASRVKGAWLETANYEVFAKSNLASKLQELYQQYAAAAGFVPGLKGVLEIAGTESALALYEIREVEFLYISRVGEAQLAQSQLWAVRNKFEQRQAGGVAFYLRTDAASRRTVAFALANGYLLLATRDDLVAHALELMAGGAGPSLASSRWYGDAVAAAQNPGELRLVMNLEALVRSVAFRSYWVQRNASVLRRYWAGVADLRRVPGSITETRVFLKTPGAAGAPAGTVSRLLALVPAQAGLYKASSVSDPAQPAELIVRKLIAAPPRHLRDWRRSPYGVSADVRAGTEADLEQHIDEAPLPTAAGVGDSEEAVRKLAEKAGARSVLLVQASASTGETFVRMHSVIVLAAQSDWDAAEVRSALSAAAGGLWTTAGVGAGWTSAAAGRHAVERLDGLGSLMFAASGQLLFLGNDAGWMAAVLDRAGARPPAGGVSYAAGFRHARERANYQRIMTALDFGQEGGPAFFSANLGSLSQVLSGIAEVRVTEEDRAGVTSQTVVYQ